MAHEFDLSPARAPSPELCRRLFIDDFGGLLLTDESGQILHANPAVAVLTGATPEEMVGTSVLDYVLPEELDTALAALGEMGEPELRDSGIPIVFAIRHRDGRRVQLEVGARDYFDERGRGMLSMRIRTYDRDYYLGLFLQGLAAGTDLDALLDPIMHHADHLLVDTAPALLHLGTDGAGVRWVGHSVPEVLAQAAAEAPAGSLPWDAAHRGQRCVMTVDELPPAVARAARAHGFGSCWTEPVFVRNDETPSASLVMWRVWSGAPLLGALGAVERLTSNISLAFFHQRAREQLVTAAWTDHLTGLANRAEMFSSLGRALEREGVGVLYVDLDRFKSVNDTRGHGTGDTVLVMVADRIRAMLRVGDVAARVGGDEFVVLCPDITREGLRTVATRLVEALSEPFVVDCEPLDLGVSVGAALASGTETTPSAVLDAADRALYRAKRAGGQRWALADEVA